MTHEEILTGNKLIAEFMGWKLTPYFKGIYCEMNNKTMDLYTQCFYHSSWDWLIPVVEKIEKTNEADIIIHAKNLVLISYNKETKKYFNASIIENTYRACIEFINWYNNQK